MIVENAGYANTHIALQRALYKAAFLRDSQPPDVLLPVDPALRHDLMLRQRSRFDAAIDRARARMDTPETLGLLLAIADLTAVARAAGWDL